MTLKARPRLQCVNATDVRRCQYSSIDSSAIRPRKLKTPFMMT